MKNPLVTFLFLSVIVCSGFSQSFKLSDDFRDLSNGSEIYISGPADTLQLINWMHLTNTSASTKLVLMKKQNLSMLPGATSALCWAGYCYSTEMPVTTFPLEMLQGQTESGCFAHYGPDGKRGESIVRWTFFDAANPNDSISITTHYLTFAVLAREVSEAVYGMAVENSFSTKNLVLLNYTLPQGYPARIEIRALSGALVAASGQLNGPGQVRFEASGWPSGIWIALLVAEGRPVVTRKLITCH